MSDRRSSECHICGAPATCSYYGARACGSCKIFFRRHATDQKKIWQCQFDDQCEVNIHNRHICSACRLKKCFQMGMSVELIRCSYTKPKENTALSVISRSKRSSQQDAFVMRFPTLNLLQSDISTLTKDDWILLSNLVHNYDESNMKSICRRWINTNKNVHSSNKFDETLTAEFFQLFLQTTETCLRSNGDICALSFNDRSTLVRTGAECVACFSGPFLMHHYRLITCPLFVQMLRNVYGETSVALTFESLKCLDFDRTLMKVAPLLLLFSENTYIFSSRTPSDRINSKVIFDIQNRYVEVVWKYLLYNYDIREAIRRFLRLIQFLFSTIRMLIHLQSIQSHVHDMESVVEHTELQLVLDDIEKIDGP